MEEMWESIHELMLDFHEKQHDMEDDEADLLWTDLMNVVDDMMNFNKEVANNYFEEISYNFNSSGSECDEVLNYINALIMEKISSDKTIKHKDPKIKFWKMLFEREKLKNNGDQLNGSKIMLISLFAILHYLD